MAQQSGVCNIFAYYHVIIKDMVCVASHLQYICMLIAVYVYFHLRHDAMSYCVIYSNSLDCNILLYLSLN